MAVIDKEFSKICKEIFTNGKEYTNERRGVKRLQIPSYTFRYSFDNGFPALTNKKLFLKSIVGELIWFLRGDNNTKYLYDNGISIWDGDACNYFDKYHGLKFKTDLKDFQKIVKHYEVGQNYSVQWRNFNGNTDQIQELISGMKADIMGSRLKVSAWNPSELNKTALPPCHDGFQIIGVPLENGEFGFELHWNQRSVDTFLGLPFNIASYAILAKILEKITGYKALGIEGTLKCVHFYDNQYEAVRELLERNTDKHTNCKIELSRRDKNSNIDVIFNALSIEDFKLINYASDKAIKVDMLAPKKI